MNLRKQPSSRMCFVCGRDNPAGLRMSFDEDADTGEVVASLNIPDKYQGFPGVAHGGIVAAVLDETAGRAIFIESAEEAFMATVRLTVRYRRPTPTGVPLTAVGWLVRRGGMAIRAAGEIRLPDGTVTADCECILAPAPDEFLERWESEKGYWRVG